MVVRCLDFKVSHLISYPTKQGFPLYLQISYLGSFLFILHVFKYDMVLLSDDVSGKDGSVCLLWSPYCG